MNSPLRPFFELCFAGQFTRYQPEWITLGLEMIEEHRELIASDLDRRYPAASPETSLAERLAQAIELDTALLGGLLYRIEHGIFRRDPLHPSLPYFAQIMKGRTGMEIYFSTEIGPRFKVMHGFGIVIGPHNRIGSDFTIYQGVTLGQRRFNRPDERIVAGDHCTLFAGAKVIGAITVGDRVRVAANAVLLSDAEPHATYAGIPAVKVSS